MSNGYEVEKNQEGETLNKILKYYLSSETHFLVYVDMFLKNGFYRSFFKDGEEYEALSSVAVEVSEHAQIHNGFYLNCDSATKYFEKGYSDIQLFSIIFAFILNRSEEEIEFLADKDNSGVPLSLLHSILCDEDLVKIGECLCFNSSIPKKRIILDNIKYNGTFYFRKRPTDQHYSYPWRSYFNKESLSHRLQ